MSCTIGRCQENTHMANRDWATISHIQPLIDRVENGNVCTAACSSPSSTYCKPHFIAEIQLPTILRLLGQRGNSSSPPGQPFFLGGFRVWYAKSSLCDAAGQIILQRDKCWHSQAHQKVRNISGKSLISMPLLHWSRHSYIEYEGVKNFVAHEDCTVFD
jgi:hypothetical protein